MEGLSGIKTLTYGISAQTLGPAVRTIPGADPGFKGWQHALIIRRFFRSGGDPLPVTPTEARLAWDDDSLYTCFRLGDPERIRRSDKNEPTPLKRKDQIILVTQNAGYDVRDFDSFTIQADGTAHAAHMNGMTYIGGEQVYSDYIKHPNTGKIRVG